MSVFEEAMRRVRQRWGETQDCYRREILLYDPTGIKLLEFDRKYWIKMGRGCGKSTIAYQQAKYLLKMMANEVSPADIRHKLRQIALGKLEKDND